MAGRCRKGGGGGEGKGKGKVEEKVEEEVVGIKRKSVGLEGEGGQQIRQRVRIAAH